MYTYYISVGSNMGDRARYIQNAYDSLARNSAVQRIVQSTLLETEPWGYTEQDAFLNGMFFCESTLEPLQMLAFLQNLEKEARRERQIHWGPRTLDLDIIWAINDKGQTVDYTDETLQLPHPHFWNRTFVLEPLAELNPTFTFHGESINRRIGILKQH